MDNETQRRGNYHSGEDFVLEYGELRFTFNERDFSERCEQAAVKLGFVSGRLDEPELEDLVNLAVNGEIQDPASALRTARRISRPDASASPTSRITRSGNFVPMRRRASAAVSQVSSS